MPKLIAQYNKISGPNAIGDYTLSFSILREHLDSLLEVVGQLEKKHQVIIDITTITETKDAQIRLLTILQHLRFHRQLHH